MLDWSSRSEELSLEQLRSTRLHTIKAWLPQAFNSTREIQYMLDGHSLFSACA